MSKLGVDDKETGHINIALISSVLVEKRDDFNFSPTLS